MNHKVLVFYAMIKMIKLMYFVVRLDKLTHDPVDEQTVFEVTCAVGLFVVSAPQVLRDTHWMIIVLWNYCIVESKNKIWK